MPSENHTLDWLEEQRRRRNSVVKACTNFRTENITEYVLRRIFVSDAHKILYCAIPKIACTNWKAIMLILNGKTVPKGKNVHHVTIPSLKDFSAEEVDRRLREYKKLIIVRNPHERLLSAYNDKFADRNKDSYFVRNYSPVIRKNTAKYMKRKYNRKYATDKKAKITFQDFVRYVGNVENKLSRRPECHWREIYQLCSPCAIQYDYILKLETMSDDARYILSSINASHLLSVVKATPHPTNSSSEGKVQRGFAQVTEEDVMQFEKRFAKDMSLFDYQRPPSITQFKSEDDMM